MYSRVVLAGNQSKQHGGHRRGNFTASKFISSFSPKATTSQLQNLRIRKIFMKRQDKLNFSPIFSQLLDFLCLSFTVVKAGSHVIAAIASIAPVCDQSPG